MIRDRTNPPDPQELALRALAATLADERLAARLLATTGLDPAGLRLRLAQPALLAAVLDFLAAHEPDLLAVAAAIGERPETLAAASGMLRG
jgi:hypothetical protein